MRQARWGIAAALLVLAAILNTPDSTAARGDTASPGEAVHVIISLRDEPALRGDPGRYRADLGQRAARVSAALPKGARILRTHAAVPALVVALPASASAALARHPDVAGVTPDVPIHATLDESGALINADDAHALTGITGAGVTVAVMDTGIDTDHPGLADDLTGQACFLIAGGCPQSSGVTGGCPTGATTTTGVFAEDGHGHGTHVSGIISAGGHDGGQDVGIAPGASVKAFKILNDCGQGDISNIVAAFDAILLSHPDVDVINMSVGDGTSNAPGTCDTRIPAMTAAVETARAAGIITFGSSGNSGSKAGIGYPGCISAVVSVGAVYDAAFNQLAWSPCTDINVAPDDVVCFSQSGADLDLLAPGALVESAFPGGLYLNLAGTSMSSPAAAAVAALVLEDTPGLAPTALETRIKVTGVPVTDAANGITTCRVDALKAVRYLGPLCQASPLDTDGDGCSDAEEATFDVEHGGRRDPLEFWDFFDVDGDASIDLSDALSVLSYFGDPALPATPGDLRDRMIPDPGQPWRTAEANDGVDLGDALNSLRSFGHDCSGAP